MQNIDTQAIHHFDQLAAEWWNPQGAFRTLHQINPARLTFIRQFVDLSGLKILDVGCGGGILTEALAQFGAEVHGIDLSHEAISMAQAHAKQHDLAIQYQAIAAEDLATQLPEYFDMVVCYELLEHVPAPLSIIQACKKLLKPEGHLFLSTINRTLKAFSLGIVAAEYLLKLLPRGTHHYQYFIKPSELADMLRQSQLNLKSIKGLTYSPWQKLAYLSDDVSINYLIYAQK